MAISLGWEMRQRKTKRDVNSMWKLTKATVLIMIDRIQNRVQSME